ncbi:fibronectin type III domain-containing protein [Curtobacterium sp. Curtsp57]|uniref:fibronectin type III domain-containing protein n=1 Tax=Curtobacterium sp. Curtsp57 TaxID=3243047 RepID=UPI0039B364F3
MLSSLTRTRRRARLSAVAVAATLATALGLLVAPPANAVEPVGTLDVSIPAGGSPPYPSATWGQTFTAGRTGKLTAVSLDWTLPGSGGSGAVTLQAAANGVPTGPVLASATISTDTGWQTAVFSSPARLTAGTVYALSIPIVNTAMYSTSVYAGGAVFHGGLAYPNYDLPLRTYMQAVPAPTGFTASAGDGTTDLAWDPVASTSEWNVTGYETSYAVSGSGQWSAPVASTGTTAQVSGLTDGTAYDFRVRATSDIGSGEWSTTASATPMGDFTGGALHVATDALAVGVARTATSDGWSPTPNLAWSWTAGGTQVGTAPTYTPTPDDLGKDVQVTVTATAVGRHPQTRTVDLGIVGPGTITTGDVELRGADGVVVGSTVDAGTTVTASVPGLAPSTATLTYQWFRGADTPIEGATGSSYTVTGDDAFGRGRISVAVTATERGYSYVTVSSGTPYATYGVQQGSVTTDAAKVGQPTTATVPAWTPSTATLSYQWYAGERAIRGATGNTYTPTADQAGADLIVTVSGTARGYHAQQVTSAPVVIAPGTQTGTVAIQGDATVGSELTAVDSDWQDDTAFTRQWTRDGQPIDGATGRTYRLVGADAGATIGLTVTGTLAGYEDRTVDAPATGAVALGTQHASVTIAGADAARVGTALTTTDSGWATGTTVTHQWLRDGEPIEDATGAGYTPTDADLGHVLTVAATGELTGWEPLTVTSAGTRAVVGTPAVVTPGGTLPTTVTAGEPFRSQLDVSGSPRPTLTLDGHLPTGLEFDAETGVVSGIPTEAGHHVVRFTADNGVGIPSVTTLTIDVVAGPLAELTLATTGTGEVDGAVTAKQGSTIHVLAAGLDEWGNELESLDGLVLTSSVDSDVIDGDAVTFRHASPHVLTATVGAVTASVLVEVSPTAVVSPTDPTTPAAPVAVRPGVSAPAPTAAHPAAELAYTGSASTGPLAVAALLALLLGAALRVGARRRRERI